MTEDFSADIDAWLSIDEGDAAPSVLATAAAPDELIAEPTMDLVAEPMAQLIAEPTTEWVAELIAEPTAELIAAPMAAPVPPARPASLLDAIAALPGTEDEAPAAPVPAAVATRSVPRYVLFSVAGAHYAVFQPHVTELDRVPAFTLVPNVPAWVRGITNRRGDILSVVDARALLGIERLAPGNGRMLVVRLLDDSCSLGLLVDEVHQIVSVPPGEVRDPGPGLDGPLAPFLTGLVELEERTVAVLDMEGFLRSPLVRQFDEPVDTAAHSHH